MRAHAYAYINRRWQQAADLQHAADVVHLVRRELAFPQRLQTTAHALQHLPPSPRPGRGMRSCMHRASGPSSPRSSHATRAWCDDNDDDHDVGDDGNGDADGDDDHGGGDDDGGDDDDDDTADDDDDDDDGGDH